jgi:hypothetical protein
VPSSDLDQRAHAAILALLDGDRLLVRLHLEGAQPHSHDSGGGAHAKVSGSPTPFADRFTMLALEIEAGARRLHSDLLCLVHNRRQKLPSDARTARVLLLGELGYPSVVVLLGAAQRLDAVYADAVVREIEGWARHGRGVLDEAHEDETREWTRLPVAKVVRSSRYQRLGCHVCGSPLWLYRGFAHNPDAPAWCRNEACRNPDDGQLRSYPQSVWRLLIEVEDVLTAEQAAMVLEAA